VATTKIGYRDSQGKKTNRVQSMSHTASNSTLGSGTSLASYSLGWDLGGRLVSMTSTADDAATFTYDRTDQLKSATYQKPAYADLTFSYDANGNRTGGGNTPGPDNRQASDGVSDFAYDLDGNMTRRTNKTTGAVVEYAWDLRNRLTDVTFKSSATGPATKKVHYTYDALNRRIGKSVDTDGNGTLDQVDWYANRGLRTDRENAGDEVMLRLGASGNVTERYLHGASVDEILAEENIASDGKREVLWTLADQQGSVRDIVRLGTNGQATVVDHIMYGPYGEKVAETDTAIAHLYGYTGREYDKETGLQYNRARYYDPKLGRWISQDPIGFAAGDANLYRYVGNSPTNSTDPSGLIDPLGPTRTRPWEFFDSWSESQRVAWLKNQWGRYGSSIEKAASKHGVPEDLLTVVVFNEMMDYSVWEWMGERMGFGSSCGPGQLTQKALVSHGIYPDSMKIDGQPRVGRYPPRIENEADAAMAVQRYRKWQSKYRSALNDPDTSIDLLAQLVGVYVQILKDKTNTTDGSWGLPNRVVSSVIGMPLSNDSADKFRLELSRCGRAKTRVSQSMMAVIQAMTNDTETVLTEEGINDNVLQHIWNAGGLHPYINNNQHK
jgi:RHS repeat-associated protein